MLPGTTSAILETTFSLLNDSNPTLAGDCWLCMTTGVMMPLAIPVNNTIQEGTACGPGLPFRVQVVEGFIMCLIGSFQNTSNDVDVGFLNVRNCSVVTK